MVKALVLIGNEVLGHSILDCLHQFGSDLEVVGSARMVTDGLRMVNELEPDLVVVSEQLLDGKGLELLRLTGSLGLDSVFLFQSEDSWLEALQYGAVSGRVRMDGCPLTCITSLLGKVLRRREATLDQKCEAYFASLRVDKLDHIGISTTEGFFWLDPTSIEGVISRPGGSTLLMPSGMLEVEQSVGHLAPLLSPLGFRRMGEQLVRVN